MGFYLVFVLIWSISFFLRRTKPLLLPVTSILGFYLSWCTLASTVFFENPSSSTRGMVSMSYWPQLVSGNLISWMSAFFEGLWWVEGILFLIALGVGLGLHFFRVKFIEENRKLLESKFQERTRELLGKHRQIEAQNDILTAQTKELSIQNEELEATIDQLKLTQSQLIHYEKMASLGLLAKGIAHEINNPINFVKTGTTALKSIIDSFKQVSTLYNEINEENLIQKMDEIESIKKQTNFDEVVANIDKVTKHIDVGANRAVKIVKGLSAYSRPETKTFVSYDITEAIENNLLLINYLLKNHIEIHKELEEGIKISCSPSQINQVIINILVNAIQAIEGEGSIFIKAHTVTDHAIIQVRDTGKGIPQPNLKKIFDPFFTTKEVGQGTGLGLSISLGIINEHNGVIEVESTENKGTTIEIMLPIASN